MSRNARRGIFFDLDGVLADGLDAMRQVFAEFAAAFGHDASDEEFAAVNGMPVPVLVAGLKRDWTLPEKLHELLAHYDALIDARAFDLVPGAGAAATLEAAFQNGWKVGVVTSLTGARARAWLARTGLAAFVDVVIGGDQLCLGRPDPEPYFMALTRAGCSREVSIAVEASLQGARSALAAGLRTLGLASERRDPIQWPDSVRLIATIDELIPELARPRLRRVAGRF